MEYYLCVPILILHLLPIVLGTLPADENCTTIREPRVSRDGEPRIGCAAESCLICNNANAQCVHNGTSDTVTCIADTSSCSVELCPQCNYCVGTYTRRFGSSSFRHTSLCFSIPTGKTCEEVPIHEQCVLNQNVSSESDVFAPSSDGAVSYHCGCHGENCTVRLLYSYSILPQISAIVPSQPPPTVPSSVAMRTASLLVTPTPGIDGDDPIPASTYIIAISTVGAVLATILVAVLIVCIIKMKRKFFHSTPKRTRRHTENSLSEQAPLPWCLNERIGQGRFGSVYKATYNNQIVAVKIFSYNSRHSWENECNLCAMESTAHGNILEFMTSQSQGSGYNLQLFIVARYYPFGSLNQYLRGHTVSWEQSCTMIHNVACGLSHLHSEYYTNSSGICAEKYAVAHRDVKSANVLVRNERGECVLSDLGLALILDPSVDVKQLANTGQVGTFRYMAPEALDARVNLHDLQSFKQIDVYAFALVMWEIVWRCALEEDDDVPNYQLPFQDLVGERPALDLMRETVVTNKLRPPLSPSWRSHQGLSTLVETIQECWDEDPEARLSAANVFMRMEDLLNINLSPNEANSCYQSNTSPPPPPLPGDIFCGPPENSDSRPPPYSDIPLGPIAYQRRPHFQTSMPHILIGEGGDRGYGFQHAPPQRGVRSLRNSVILEGEVVPRFGETPLSVRNSLVLGTTNHLLNQQNSVFLGNIASSRDDQESLDQRDPEFNSGLDSETSNLNSDSGFQNFQTEHSSSATSLSSADVSSQFNPSTEASTDFEKHLEESTDTLDAVGPHTPATTNHLWLMTEGTRV